MRGLAFAVLMLAAGLLAAQEAPVETATQTEADGTVTMAHSALVAAPPAEVWTAISTPEGWMTWAVPLARWVGEVGDVLETGYNPDEPAGGPGAIRQQFVARIPGRLLVFRTIKTPDGFPHGDEYRKVTGIFELMAEGAGTRVRLTSVGYPDSDGGRALVRFFAAGNRMALESLQRRFAGEAKAE